MNARDIRRISKTAFRKALCRAPMPLKRYLTKKEINLLTGYLLPVPELRKCEQHPELRREILEKHKQSHPKAVERLEKEIRAVIDETKNTVDEARMASLRDQIEYAYFAYGFQPNEFITYHLDERDIRTFLSDTERKCVKHAMNDFTQSVLADKAKIYRYFKKWYNRDAAVIDSDRDFGVFTDFVKKHPEYVVKIVNSSRGKGVWLQKSSDDYRHDFDEIRKKGKVLLEERIEQHELLNRFNASSINTIRVSTYLTRDGVIPAHGVIRTGRSGSFVDNAGSGGIEARLDVAKGVVISDGIDKFGNTYEVHPDSGTAYKGFQLPDWDALLSICKEASLLFPEIKYKSFDFSYSTNGWVIVEVNPSGEYGVQACMKDGIKEKVRQLAGNMDLMYPYELR